MDNEYYYRLGLEEGIKKTKNAYYFPSIICFILTEAIISIFLYSETLNPYTAIALLTNFIVCLGIAPSIIVSNSRR